jgi:hypothetical protein
MVLSAAPPAFPQEMGGPWFAPSEGSALPCRGGGAWRGFCKERVTGPPGFEPGFEAPEASVMSKLYYGPARRIRSRTVFTYLLEGPVKRNLSWTILQMGPAGFVRNEDHGYAASHGGNGPPRGGCGGGARRRGTRDMKDRPRQHGIGAVPGENSDLDLPVLRSWSETADLWRSTTARPNLFESPAARLRARIRELGKTTG